MGDSSGPPAVEHKTKAEEIAEHGIARGGNAITSFFRDSPFLFVSLVVHVVILVLLTFFTVSTPPTVAVRIPLPMEVVEIPEEVPPLRREENLALGATATGGLGYGASAEASESLTAAVSKTSPVEIAKVNLVGVSTAVSAGSEGDFEKAGGEFQLAPGKGGKTVGGAVDQFAIVTLNSLMRGKTLVVLLVDQSRSIVYGDLPLVIQRMDHYFKEMENNLPAGMESRGEWVVASFGRTCEIRGEPSSDLAYVKNRLASVTVDTSGVENVGEAVQTVLRRFAGRGYKYILIAALTDEAGDDINNPAVLERVTAEMRRAGARFFVFGNESVFCARQKLIVFTLKQEIVRGPDRDAIRGFEGRTIYGWADGGPECPRPELWWGANWGLWSVWGGAFNNLASGFGMYGLNRMVLATGGTYFLVKPESKYDEEKLYGRYKPDMCSMLEYDQRMVRSRLRRELTQTWKEMGYFYLSYDLRSGQDIETALQKSLSGRAFCAQRARELEAVLRTSEPEAFNAARWEAHGDITLAELWRFHFMLGQYHEVMRRTWERQGRQLPPGKRFILSRGKVPDDYVGPKQAKEEYDQALQYIERVLNKHKDTPWAVVAGGLKNNVYPWKCELADIPKPPVGGGPAPPSMSF